MIQGATGTSSAAQSLAQANKQNDTSMSKDAFLQLLVTQLQNQDPLNPMDNTQFVSQLAQFSSLEGIQNLNDSMKGVSSGMQSLQDYSSAALIGKNARAESSTFQFNGTNAAVGFSLDADSADTRLVIRDGAGRIVKEMAFGPVKAGYNEALWDGKDAIGLAAKAGKYSFSVEAKDAKGSQVTSKTYISGAVTGVNFGTEKTTLSVAGTEITRDSIREIY